MTAPLRSIRLYPTETEFLSQYRMNVGDIFYDKDKKTLVLYDGISKGGVPLLRADLDNAESGLGVSVNNTPPSNARSGSLWFNTNSGVLYVYVEDEDSVQWVQPSIPQFGATSPNGAVTGPVNYTLPTASTTVLGGVRIDGTTITINNGVISAVASGGSGISLTSLSVTVNTASGSGNLTYNNNTGQFTFTPPNFPTSLTALSDVAIVSPSNGQVLKYNSSTARWVNAADLTGDGGTGIGLTDLSVTTATASGSGSLTYSNSTGIFTFTPPDLSSISGGATTFTGLSDRADLTVDQFYLSAITRLNVTNSGASSYRFDQYGTADNPTIYVTNGATIAFNLNVTGHPFLIQTSGGVNYNEGLTHVTTAGVVTTGSSAQGKTSGTLYWKVPTSISGNYRYICSIHSSMVGVITVNPVTVTASSVGLGNVTNESKATMFTSPTFTGTTTLQQTVEILNTITGATGTVVHNFSTGAIWVHASIASNFTANFTNVPTTADRAISIVLVLVQGATPYIPNAVQIDGAAQTILWQDNTVPTGNANKRDLVSFTLIRTGSSWTVLGSLSTYG